MGELSGVFVAEKPDVQRAFDSGAYIHFGEVLGKHSDISATINSGGEVVMVTDDPAVIELFEKHDLSSGINPLDYYAEEE